MATDIGNSGCGSLRKLLSKTAENRAEARGSLAEALRKLFSETRRNPCGSLAEACGSVAEGSPIYIYARSRIAALGALLARLTRILVISA